MKNCEDELTEQAVADRLGKSRRWVQQWLADDADRENPRGQFHHYMGASRRWTEQSFQKLREAMRSVSAERKAASKPSGRTARGTLPAHYALTADQSAFEKVLGLPAERPEHEAEAARLRLETQLVTEAVYGIKPSATFSMVTLTWLNTAQPGAADVRMSKALVRRFGAKTVREISAADVGAFVASLGNRKPATVNRYLNPLHAILATGVRLGFAETVPHFERPRIKKARINKMLSMDEIDILFDGLAPHAADIVALLGTSGCRVSEAIYLQIPDVILAPGRERVLFRDTKNGESYNAALHPFAIPYLVRAIGTRQEGAVFLTQRGLPYREKMDGGGQIKTAWRTARAHLVAALKEAGQHERAKVMATATPHWLRHTFASHLMAQGESVTTIMEAGRWKTARLVWETYGHLAPGATKDAIHSLPFGRNKADDEQAEGKMKA